MLGHPLSEKMFTYVWRKPLVFQVVPTASFPVTEHHREEAPSSLDRTSLQVFIYIGKTSSILWVYIKRTYMYPFDI